MDALQLDQARVVDLAEHGSLKPVVKTNGYGMPGFLSGHYRMRDRRKAFCLLTDASRVLYLPLRDGSVLVLSPEKPRELLAALPEWTAEAVGVALHDAAAALEMGMGKVAQPLRVAITGTQVSPDISHTVYLAGREQALKRIDVAITKVATA